MKVWLVSFTWKGWRSENTASGMANNIETIQIKAALRQIFIRAWDAWISIGRTMALYLSADSAVSVKTDTPTEVSCIKGISLQPILPNSHLSARYLLASTGAHVTSSSRSPKARLEMNRFGTFRMDLTVQKILMSVMLPIRPITMISP